MEKIQFNSESVIDNTILDYCHDEKSTRKYRLRFGVQASQESIYMAEYIKKMVGELEAGFRAWTPSLRRELLSEFIIRDRSMRELLDQEYQRYYTLFHEGYDTLGRIPPLKI